eukprot:g66972.t1
MEANVSGEAPASDELDTSAVQEEHNELIKVGVEEDLSMSDLSSDDEDAFDLITTEQLVARDLDLQERWKSRFRWSLLALAGLLVTVMYLAFHHHPPASQNLHAAEGTVLDPVCIFQLEHFTTQIAGVTINRLRMTGSGSGYQVNDGIGVCHLTEHAEFHVQYHNTLGEETAMHAHGLRPPTALDGVPYVTSLPMLPDRVNNVRFKLKPGDCGMHLLHSHYSSHHAEGLHVPLLIDADMPWPPQVFPAELVSRLAAAQVIYMELSEKCPLQGLHKRKTNVGSHETEQTDCASFLQIFQAMQMEWATMNKTDLPECPTPADSGHVDFLFHTTNHRIATDPVRVPVSPGR